ncbi:MAG: hypothetical protein IIB03_08475 [Acidobacteria bacterium]|nr:hypothetical protein [Acidobacteriota bacterium]
MEAHGEFLRAELGDRKLAEAVKKDYRQAPVDAATRALLDFADKVNLDSHNCRAEDLEQLRGHGFSDEDIVDATAIIGMMNYLNRIADALGIVLNEEYRHIGKNQVGGGKKK